MATTAMPLGAPAAAAPRSGGDDAARVLEFATAHLPGIEAALQRAVCGMALPLPAMRAAIADAVGLTGKPGHRWRPLMTIAAAKACGAYASDVVDVAAAVELTHTASLILDDLPCMDDTPLRRDIPSTHVRLGSAGAILVAVGLMARSAELIAASARGANELGRAWGAAVGLDGMCGGQAIDLAVTHRAGLRGAERRLYRRKTTALSSFAVLAGGVAAGASVSQRRALESFGADFGWAYQLADDADDEAEDAARGTTAGSPHAARTCGTLLRRSARRLRAERWQRPESAELLICATRTMLRTIRH